MSLRKVFSAIIKVFQIKGGGVLDPNGQVRIRTAEPPPRGPRDWIEAELGGANMDDTQLTARLLQMAGMFYAKPTANIPEACGSAIAAKAAYRFLDNEKIEWH